MRQFVFITATSILGVVLDDRPMTERQAAAFVADGLGVRRERDLAALAVAHGAVEVAELVHRAPRWSRSGPVRRYAAETFCRALRTA